jgi:hypothetical protein
MFNKKKIAELEEALEVKQKFMSSLKEQLTDKKIESNWLRADNAMLKKKLKEISVPIEQTIIPLDWITGEPKEQGWYFVAHAEGTTTLFFNPASSRARWMRGEKGNAERFESEVIAYIKAPEYSNEQV